MHQPPPPKPPPPPAANLTGIDFFVGQERRPLVGGEGDVSQAHSGGHGERDGKPGQTAEQKAQHSLPWLGRHAALPVRLVHEDRAKVACTKQPQVRLREIPSGST